MMYLEVSPDQMCAPDAHNTTACLRALTASCHTSSGASFPRNTAIGGIPAPYIHITGQSHTEVVNKVKQLP